MRVAISSTGTEHVYNEELCEVTCASRPITIRALVERPINRAYACGRCLRITGYLAQLPERTERERAMGMLALEMAERGRAWYRS